MTEAISQKLKYLNDRRHYDTALDVYTLRNLLNEEEKDAHMHYQAALAGLMLGKSVGDIEARLERCANYTAEMRGDLKRDTALSIIRRHGNLLRAERLIREALEVHSASPQRLAIDNQALGRLMEAQGNLVGAHEVLLGAVDQLQSNTPVDTGWLSNTAFHMLRLAVKNGYRARAYQALQMVVTNDPSSKKRWAARAMYYLPAKTGVQLVARFR